MDYRLSENRKKELQQAMLSAEPYTEEELSAIPLDGDADIDRLIATAAKYALEE